MITCSAGEFRARVWANDDERPDAVPQFGATRVAEGTGGPTNFRASVWLDSADESAEPAAQSKAAAASGRNDHKDPVLEPVGGQKAAFKVNQKSALTLRADMFL